MRFRELLLEIRNLGVYSAEEWGEYVQAFGHDETLESYLAEQPRRANRLLNRIKKATGANAVEPDYTLSPKIVYADVLAGYESGLGMTLGVVSGCFDLLHLGHVRGIVYAKSFLEKYPNPKLCAMTLSDQDIRANKGPGKPLLNLNERLEMLCYIQCVDYVIPLQEPDGLVALGYLRPDFFFKDDADQSRRIVREEMELVESKGGEVVLFPPEYGRQLSTTELVAKALSER